MDPTTTWRDLLDAVAEADHDRAEELAGALRDWLRKGGFSPFGEAKTYNGWTNYETWCVQLWLTGDEARYRDCRSMIREVCRGNLAARSSTISGPNRRPASSCWPMP